MPAQVSFEAAKKINVVKEVQTERLNETEGPWSTRLKSNGLLDVVTELFVVSRGFSIWFISGYYWFVVLVHDDFSLKHMVFIGGV